MKQKYSVLIRWSEDDQLYIASLPEFGPGCSTHGSTYAIAAKNAAEVLEMLTDPANQTGTPLPRPDLFPSSTGKPANRSARSIQRKVGRSTRVA
jgi:antitoxin HicB